MDSTQQEMVTRQFGSRAAEYVTSAVHSQGKDLKRMADIASEISPKNALDLGCGGGHAAYAIAPNCEAVTAYDLSQEMLEAVRGEALRRGLANIETRRGAAEELPFRESAFDLIVCRLTAHHWSDFRAGIREARRVLKTGSRGVFIDVISPGVPVLDTALQTVEILRDPSHVRDYSASEWAEALNSARFAIHRVTFDRLRMEFASWIARMQTPPVLSDAILALQRTFCDKVRTHFEIAEDGSFTIDVAMIEVVAL